VGRPKARGTPPAGPRTSVSIDTQLHAQLKFVALEETTRRGQKVSVADLVGEAVIAMWAPSAFRPGPAATPDIEAQRQALLAEVEAMESAPPGPSIFDEMFMAALADPIPDVIGKMVGIVVGTVGQRIAVRDLTYHLRNALNGGRAITTMAELVEDYEG